jgi:anti-sigma regulatory factor (Ser/Thr protein kinase)
LALNVTTAFTVGEASQVAEPRRTVLWLADQLGFSEARAGQAALILSELATNLIKHARFGEVLLRKLSLEGEEPDAIEIVAIDKGPGLDDVAQSRADGFSTAGTLGHGLGAAQRQADEFDLYSHSTGTVAVATIGRSARWRAQPAGRIDLGAVQVSKPGETVCGDAWGCHLRERRLAILVADGLGHGYSAHNAARAAVEVFDKHHENVPAAVIVDVHAALRATRGAAVAMLAIDLERSTAAYAGLGNIAGTIIGDAGERRTLISHNGTAGHSALRVQEFKYVIPRPAIVVMASDGLQTHWNLDAYPGLRRHSATAVAAVLYRDFSRRRDDVTVVVAKERPHVAEKL